MEDGLSKKILPFYIWRFLLSWRIHAAAAHFGPYCIQNEQRDDQNGYHHSHNHGDRNQHLGGQVLYKTEYVKLSTFLYSIVVTYAVIIWFYGNLDTIIRVYISILLLH